MATNCGRLPTTKRWAALTLAVGILCPLPAVAEVPRTTAEWLAVYHERQARFDAVEIESHWQGLEGEKVVEEWDQKFYADDLGRLRLEELGRLERDNRRPDVAIVADSILAFDGSEYRELHRRWEFPPRVDQSPSAIAQLRRLPAHANQARIDAEAGDFASIRQADTPLKMADYWFLVCITNAAKAKLDPRSGAVAGHSDLWEVTLAGSDQEWGHKCRAFVHAGQDNHVTRIDLWANGRWTARYQVSYAFQDDHWLPHSGEYESLVPSIGLAGPVQARGYRFLCKRASFGKRLPDENFLPALPVGTWVGDLRTGASYQVGRSDDSDLAIDRLAGEARQECRNLEVSRAAYVGANRRLKVLGSYAAIGAVVGFLLNRSGTVLARRLSQTSSTKRGSGHEARRAPPPAQMSS